ncbi:MAG: hypothetical protein HYZ28_26170 [Myxococcales bacterium]|nr:hypothetical protein [Myxococcales bacterium]
MQYRLATVLALLALAPRAQASEAPISLTASDGTGLKLVRLVARGVVQDPLAFTELRLTFENPEARQIEGQFRITLPPGAAISRFAMRLGEHWQEGEVVERQAARRAYEDFLHRRQDPALLEQGAANEFTARVFPIPPRAHKELIVSYSHELPNSSSAYLVPLRGLPEIGELDVAVSGLDLPEASLKKSRFVPPSDFSVTPPRAGRMGLRSGDMLVARVRPIEKTEPEPVGSLLMLVDSSGSRALGFQQQVALVQKLLRELAKSEPAAPLTVASFDQGVSVVYEGTIAGFGDGEAKKLRAHGALGASSLEQALRWAEGQLKAKPRARLLLVSDGVATAGAIGGQELISLALKLKPAGARRLDTIAVGGIRDEAALQRLATAGLERDGAVIDGGLEAAAIARKLTAATRSRLEVALPGAGWVWPKSLDGIQAGDEALIYATLPPGAPVKLSVGAAMISGDRAFASVERPLLARAWAQARIASLLEQHERLADGPGERAKLKEQIVALSVQHRVLSPFTALLVLETEADYQRFQIDRRALADILTVEAGKIAILKRASDRPPPVVEKPPPLPKPALAKKMAGPRNGDDEDGAPAASEESVETGKAEAKEDAAPPPAAEAAPESRPEPSTVARDSAPAAPPAEPAPLLQERRRAAIQIIRGEDSRRAEREADAAGASEPWPRGADPYVGKYKQVMKALASKEKAKALSLAAGWHEEEQGDVMALVALGEALEASGDEARAARAYGSIIDLFPSRADMRRFAGVRLERISAREALALAVDSFAKAAEQRADHPASHRLFAFALLKQGEPRRAFEVLERGLAQRYPSGRFAGVDRILREDLGLAAAAWIKAEPGRRAEILSRLSKAGGTAEEAPSLRFVLNWETDANDVDFHIADSRGGHAYYSQPSLKSGGELYADVTTGYGPECFTIRLPPGKRAYPYRLAAHYYSIGPMGYGMGKVQIIEHDGQGGLRFEERPYVVMVNQAYVELGTVKR